MERENKPYRLSGLIGLLLLAGCGFSSQSSPQTEGGGLTSKSWSAPSTTQLDAGQGFVVDQKVAVEPDGGGTAIAVWIEQSDLDPFDTLPAIYHLYARQYHTAAGICGSACWEPATLIDTGSLQFPVWVPQIAMDDNGDAIAVWQQGDGTASRVYARRFSGGTWAVSADLLDSGGGAASPSIAVEPDGGGTAMVTYERFDSTRSQWRVYAKRRTGGIGVGGVWGSETDIGAGTICCSVMPVDFNDSENQDLGQWTSIAVDSGGAIHISYYDTRDVNTNNGALRYVTSGSPPVVVDAPAGGNVGQYTSIAVSSTGVVHISYYDQTNAALKYATCSATCTNPANWTAITVDKPANNVGQYTSIAVSSTGVLHISYWDSNAQDLKYATCSATCTNPANWTKIAVDTTGNVGQYTGIAVSSTGVVHISYYDQTNVALKYATCTSGCTVVANWSMVTADKAAGSTQTLGDYTSIAVDGDGTPHISYHADYKAQDKDIFGLRYATFIIGKQSHGPQVVMDNSGDAMATFIQSVQGICYGIQVGNNDNLTQPGETTPAGQQGRETIIPLPTARCGDDRLIANRFEASTASWQSPGPSDITPQVTLASGLADCFNQNMDGSQGQGLDVAINAFSSACVDVSEVRLVMDRTGVAFVAFKTVELNWAEQTFDSGGSDQQNIGQNCRQNNQCDSNTTFNHEEIHINARQFSTPATAANCDSTAGGNGKFPSKCWSPNKLLARWFFYASRDEANPSNTTPIIAQNCGSGNNFTNAEDASNPGAFIMNCNFSGINLSVEPDGGGTAFITAERYSSPTSSAANAVSDIVAFRFDGTLWNRWTGTAFSRVEDSGTASGGGGNNLQDNSKSWTANEWAGGLVLITGGTGAGQLREVSSNSNNQLTTATRWVNNLQPANGSTYQVLSGYDPDTLGPIDTGSPNAFDPKVGMDNAGNAVTVWTQKDGTGKWRIYSQCYANSIAAPNTCGAVATGWQTVQIIDGNVNGHDHYFSPALDMANPGGAGTSAWVLFDGFTWSTVTNRLYGTQGP
ncbi:MAG: hypothetical protein HY283_04360 [Nitrospirae bacterium]|nr:hypothetical protein [Nitrospirota bacterium]